MPSQSLHAQALYDAAGAPLRAAAAIQSRSGLRPRLHLALYILTPLRSKARAYLNSSRSAVLLPASRSLQRRRAAQRCNERPCA